MHIEYLCVLGIILDAQEKVGETDRSNHFQRSSGQCLTTTSGSWDRVGRVLIVTLANYHGVNPPNILRHRHDITEWEDCTQSAQ